MYDQDRVPDFDLENTGFLLSFGADFLNTWGSPVRYGRGYGQFRQGDRERGTHFHVDSRFSMTGANADKWVPINPGMEGLLALSIAQVIIEEDLGDSSAADALTGEKPGRSVGLLARTRIRQGRRILRDDPRACPRVRRERHRPWPSAAGLPGRTRTAFSTLSLSSL